MRAASIAALAFALTACGGGGDQPPATPTAPLGGGSSTPVSTYTAGVFQPAPSFKSRCAAPRASSGDLQGTSTDENNWLRSWTNETYLWFSEVPDLNPELYGTPAYFPLLKSGATTPSGNPKDRFHFTYPTTEWIALSQSGVQSGYGAEWFVIARTPPRRIVVAYVNPGSPAALAGLARGDEVLSINGADVVAGTSQATINALNAGLSPATAGENHTFILDPVIGSPYTVTLQSSASVTTVPVPTTSVLATPTGPVGYIVFNDHIATSESQLVSAVNTLRSASVTDLVLDLRYNGGGYLDIASELAYMIAGPVPTAGRSFERLTFNSKHPTTDPVTGRALVPIPFHSQTQGFDLAPGQPLPTLNLQRVFAITGSGTCSASESIINSLRGVGVEVIQIGTSTCGKPYGFYPTDNCGTTYFSIQFKGVNATGFGEYADGFSPTNSIAGTVGERLPGCAVNDDFSRTLGDMSEARLAAALFYRANPGSCPAPPATGPIGSAKASLDVPVDEGTLMRDAMREIRVLRPDVQ